MSMPTSNVSPLCVAKVCVCVCTLKLGDLLLNPVMLCTSYIRNLGCLSNNYSELHPPPAAATSHVERVTGEPVVLCCTAMAAIHVLPVLAKSLLSRGSSVESGTVPWYLRHKVGTQSLVTVTSSYVFDSRQLKKLHMQYQKTLPERPHLWLHRSTVRHNQQLRKPIKFHVLDSPTHHFEHNYSITCIGTHTVVTKNANVH